MIKKSVEAIDNLLDSRLAGQIKSKKLEGEQWFRNPMGWLLVSFNNPLNYKNPNAELVVLQNNKTEIQKRIKGHKHIHYGVGVGETELELVRFEAEQSDKVLLEAVDMNETFVNLFEENLRYKELEYGKDKLEAHLHRDLFQNFEPSDDRLSVHVVLGGTLGNFDNRSAEMWEILEKNTNNGDSLLLGIKLDTFFDIDLQKYRQNKYYPTFILSHVESVDEGLISWKSDGDYIKMEYDGSDVFRTRRMSKDALIDEARGHNFEHIESWACDYNHSMVSLFRKSI